MMIKALQAASYIYNRYRTEYGKIIDEMKLHKLLYFSQRESLIMLGEPMFCARFSAWKYGPVLVSIRRSYRNGTLNCRIDDEDINKYEPVFDQVFKNYAPKSSWSLSELSHGESSWQKARNNMPEGAKCTSLISVTDIKADAERMKMRRLYFNEILPRINANKG